MRYLFDIYSFRHEPLGQLWLTTGDVNMIRTRGMVRVMLERPFSDLATSGPYLNDTEEYSLETISVGLERHRDGSWYLETDATAEQLARAKSFQDRKMRFPVPISLFPG